MTKNAPQPKSFDRNINLQPLSNEPSDELQKLANNYLANPQNRKLHRTELMAHWCEFLSNKSPELLELPVIQLIKAITRASMHKERLQVVRSC
jgi:hypothetical protein